MVTSRERPKGTARKPAAAPRKKRAAPKRKPLSQLIAEIGNRIPDDVIATFPTDGAEQHDHYIYGTPKRR